MICITLIISYNIIDLADNALILSLMLGGVSISILASVALSFSFKQTVLASNGEQLTCKVVEFKESVYDEMIEAANARDWTMVGKLSNGGSGTAMKIEFVYAKECDFAAYQLFRYVSTRL